MCSSQLICLFITRLRSAEPPAITFATTRSRTRSWHLVPTRQVSVHGASPFGICKTAVLREPITIFRTRVRSTLRTLEF